MTGSGQQLGRASRFEAIVVGLLSGVIALAVVGSISLMLLRFAMQMYPGIGPTLLWILPVPGLVAVVWLTISLMNFYEKSTGNQLRNRTPRLGR